MHVFYEVNAGVKSRELTSCFNVFLFGFIDPNLKYLVAFMIFSIQACTV